MAEQTLGNETVYPILCLDALMVKIRAQCYIVTK